MSSFSLWLIDLFLRFILFYTHFIQLLELNLLAWFCFSPQFIFHNRFYNNYRNFQKANGFTRIFSSNFYLSSWTIHIHSDKVPTVDFHLLRFAQQSKCLKFVKSSAFYECNGKQRVPNKRLIQSQTRIDA